MSQWDDWLAALKAAGKGGVPLPQLTIDRGRAWSKAIRFAVDYSSDTFVCNLGVAPDGTTLVSPSVSVGAYTGGYTTVTLSLTAMQTANIALIPSDGDLDGVEVLVMDLLRNSSRLLGGTIPVVGKV